PACARRLDLTPACGPQSRAAGDARGGYLGAATPEPAIAPRDEWQAVVIARPARVFWQLEILLRGPPALAVLSRLLHLGRGLLHERQDVLRVFLGAEPAARLTGMSGDQPFPVQRQQLLDEVLRFERIDVDEAAARKRSDRDRVDDKDDL